jgi:hypothetical protein
MYSFFLTIYFNFNCLSLSVFIKIVIFNFALSCPALQATSQRLGEAAAYTTFAREYYLSISHVTFMRVTAAVAPNRSLAAGVFPNCRLFTAFQICV